MAKGRTKGEKNKYWSKEDKYKVIKPILEFEKSSREVTRETGISNGMISNWIKIYNETGINGLENQNKPGNSLSKYSNKKNLKDMEKLQYGKYEIKN